MKVQGYIEIDYQEMTEAQYAEFSQKMQEFFIDFYRIDEGDREYYFCILQDDSKISEVLEFLTERNPTLNGVWDIEATPYGKNRIVSEEGVVSIEGEATYSFDLTLHLAHTPPDVIINEDGITTETKVTEFRALHGFAGWSAPTEY